MFAPHTNIYSLLDHRKYRGEIKKYNQAQAAGARTLSFSTGHRIVHIHASCKHAWMQWSYRKGILYWMHKHGLAIGCYRLAVRHTNRHMRCVLMCQCLPK